MAACPTFSSYWSDGAVIQRDRPFTIRGNCEAGRRLLLSLAGASVETQAGPDGNFEARFKPIPAGGPFEFLVDGESIARNLMAGELWFAAGQSNMELPLVRCEAWPGDGKHLTGSPLVRIFRGTVSPSFEGPATSLTGGRWVAADSDELPQLPALAYHYARLLQEELKLAVGVIDVAVGGSPIRAWLPPAVCDSIPAYREEYRSTPDSAGRALIVQEEQERAARWYGALDAVDQIKSEGEETAAWQPCQLPATWQDCGAGSEAGAVWFRKTITLPSEFSGGPARLALGGIIDSDRTWLNGFEVGSTPYQYPPRRYDVPENVLRPGRNTLLVRSIAPQGSGGFVRGRQLRLTLADRVIDLAGDWEYCRGALMPPLPFWTFFQYHAGGLHDGHTAPFAGLPIRGCLWYQGESDTEHPARYGEDFALLVAAWRSTFGDETLPVLAVQLPEYGPLSPVCVESGWARVRDFQRRATATIGVHLSVALGLGQWHELHPPLKEPLARRLILLALRHVYGNTKLQADSPLPERAFMDKKDVLIVFRGAQTGLSTSDGLPPAFFSIRDTAGNWQPVRARIEGNRVRLLAGQGEAIGGAPVAVRYAWADSPDGANLSGASSLLPASPFELDIDRE